MTQFIRGAFLDVEDGQLRRAGDESRTGGATAGEHSRTLIGQSLARILISTAREKGEKRERERETQRQVGSSLRDFV